MNSNRKTFQYGEHKVTIETGAVARQADGAVIVDIEPQSPAARVGFRVGDVVVKAQGEEVESAEELASLVEGDSRLWRITFNRGGRVSSIVIGG